MATEFPFQKTRQFDAVLFWSKYAPLLKAVRQKLGEVAIFTVTLSVALIACVVAQVLVLEGSSRLGVFPLYALFGFNFALIAALALISSPGHQIVIRLRSTATEYLTAMSALWKRRRGHADAPPVVLMIVRRNSARQARVRSASVGGRI